MQEAGQRVQDLRAELEAVIRSEFSGEDKTEEKAALRDKIADAEKAQEEAIDEQAKAFDYTRVAAGEGRITVRDLIVNWNQEYKHEVRKREIQPIFDRLHEARTMYLNALLDLYELRDEYHPLYSEIREKVFLDNDDHPGNGLSLHEIVPLDFKPISRPELIDVMENRKLPIDVKREVK